MVHSWTSYKTVLSKLADVLPANNWNELEMLDRISEAMESVGVYPMLESDAVFLEVENYKAKLPRGLVAIEQVAYKPTALDEADITEIQKYVGHNNDFYYNGFLASQYFTKCYFPLRLANSTFASQFHIDDSVNLNVNAEHTYSITPSGYIRTSFESAWIVLAYLKYPQDECGDFLIPDNPDLIMGMVYYCLAMYWLKQSNMDVQGAQGKFIEFMRLWELKRKSASGELNMPSIDQLEDIRQMKNRMFPRERRYYSFFGNLATTEVLDMSGIWRNV